MKEIEKEDEYDMWAPLSVKIVGYPGRDVSFPVHQTDPRFRIDLDLEIRCASFRDLKFRVRFSQPLQVQG